MIQTWPQVLLGSLADFRNGLNYTQEARRLGGLPIVGVSDFQDRVTLDIHSLEELDATAINCGETSIQRGDILFVRSNGNRDLIGRSLLVSREPARLTTYSGFAIRVRFRDERADPRFFAYLFRGPIIRRTLSSQGGGTNISNLNQGILANLKVPLPPLLMQRRIASMLGAYDDLIENNRRRIAILEEMARRLFEEWFVNFRFPGHEGVRIVETKEGHLPRGWRSTRVDELVQFDPSTPVPREGMKPFIPMASLATDCSLIDSVETRSGNSGAKFRTGDTLLARITPCLENGKTGLVRDLPGGAAVGFGSTEFIVMRGLLAGPAFTYLLARLPSFREKARISMSGATGRQRARVEFIRAYQFPAPPNALLGEFERLAWPMLQLSGKLGAANRSLCDSRDLLLPRLISGQLPIESAERELEAAD